MGIPIAMKPAAEVSLTSIYLSNRPVHPHCWEVIAG